MSPRRRAPSTGDLDLFGWSEAQASPAAPAAEPADAVVPAPRARRRESRAAARALVDAPAAPSYELEAEEDIPGASARSAVSVATLTRTAKDVLEGAFVPLWVRGEVSDFKAHRNGHWYFCLRDGDAQVRCVMWSRDRQRVPASPDDGMQVVVLGQITVYPARGEMQFVVRGIEAEGDGLWRKALEATLRRLDADGLLAAERKRPLPRFPRRVAVITSLDGAALHDVIAVIRRRCPAVEVIVVPAAVQGEGAPASLVRGLDQVARWGAADTVIIGRGGGAREDLWAFNDEAVARAVAGCPIPVISAVGHEVDVTLCDLVADVRAPTPSAAAEAAVPVLAEARAQVAQLRDQLCAAAARRVTDGRRELARAAERARAQAERVVERRRARIEQAAARLDALSPLATIARGYAVARSPEGEPLTSARDFARGMPFTLVLRDGEVRATADAVERGGARPRRR